MNIICLLDSRRATDSAGDNAHFIPQYLPLSLHSCPECIFIRRQSHPVSSIWPGPAYEPRISLFNQLYIDRSALLCMVLIAMYQSLSDEPENLLQGSGYLSQEK